MKILGIDFVPLNAPLKDRIEAFAAGLWFVLFIGLLPGGIFVTIFLLFFTRYWPIVCIYLFWIWVIDGKVSETGGRSSDWVRSWTLHKYVRNYFPITFKAEPGFILDPKRNYLTCVFPHGYFPIGSINVFQTTAFKEVKDLIPHHTLRGLTLRKNFFIPLYREYLLAMGACSVTPASINWLLGHPGGGKAAAIFVGGAAEALFCSDGQYRLVLKNRKGYAKLALKNGSPIMPCFAFGQNRNFKLVMLSEDSIGYRVQDFFKRITGIAFPIIYGRGLFQYTFGCIPLQNPINVVLGTCIDVPKIEEPSQQDIDDLHQRFIDKLTQLFERYKYEYEKNPEQCSLIIS